MPAFSEPWRGRPCPRAGDLRLGRLPRPAASLSPSGPHPSRPGAEATTTRGQHMIDRRRRGAGWLPSASCRMATLTVAAKPITRNLAGPRRDGLHPARGRMPGGVHVPVHRAAARADRGDRRQPAGRGAGPTPDGADPRRRPADPGDDHRRDARRADWVAQSASEPWGRDRGIAGRSPHPVPACIPLGFPRGLRWTGGSPEVRIATGPVPRHGAPRPRPPPWPRDVIRATIVHPAEIGRGRRPSRCPRSRVERPPGSAPSSCRPRHGGSGRRPAGPKIPPSDRAAWRHNPPARPGPSAAPPGRRGAGAGPCLGQPTLDRDGRPPPLAGR